MADDLPNDMTCGQSIRTHNLNKLELESLGIQALQFGLRIMRARLQACHSLAAISSDCSVL